MIQIGQAVETEIKATSLTPVKRRPASDRGKVTRREIVYDEEGREAGEEIVYESRDAIAQPKTVEAKANVPAPTVVAGKALSVTPELPKSSIQQGDRPGWTALCADAGEGLTRPPHEGWR